MERKKNFESPDAAWGRPYPEDPLEDWDGQDSSLPEERWEPDAIDLLLHPELAQQGAEAAGRAEDGYAEDDGSAEGFPPGGAAPLPWPPEAASAKPALSDAEGGAERRWGTGLYYPSGAEIPPTHPDHGPMHLLPRREDGGFSAYYYCSKAELADAGITSPPPRRHRRDGFHPERQEQFIRALRDTGSFTDAARIVGISRSTGYNLYNNPDAPAFRTAVDEALKGTEIILEATALDRAVKGNEEIVWYKGRRVGVRWKADNRLLMFMLRARNPLKYAPLSEIEGWLKRRGLEPPADLPAALDRLHAAEAEWGRHLPGEETPASPAIAAAPQNPPIASTSSTSPDSGQSQDASLAPTSSSSTESGQSEGPAALPAPPAAPDPGSPRIYRPPLAGRLRAAGDGGG